jgi:hypothetical protein
VAQYVALVGQAMHYPPINTYPNEQDVEYVNVKEQYEVAVGAFVAVFAVSQGVQTLATFNMKPLKQAVDVVG